MTPERYQQIKSIVAEALERNGDARSEFVRHACGSDESLRRGVQSMLDQSTDRLERAADRLGSAFEQDGSLAGLQLGAYEIIREIGRGGMGAVYLARRADEAFEKEVAIKLLKRGTDTDEVLRRFQAERQILARLEHPNIARLLDAGTTGDGLPFFVMEHVEGVPITEFCRERKLNTRERIELILPVCSAVQFAHQNLVVHRDVKPRNILVAAEGVPKLLDFGIAKLLADGAASVQVTVQGGQRLTPGYASPEQVRGDAITTASDVYSLGALLYELLAGSPPHRFETQNPSPTELFRVIVEREPPRVSAIAIDLDTILRKALSKEPARRYATASELADDLRRHFEGRPVRARRATLGYRASRFISRNKLGVAAAAVFALTLIGGIAATVWQAREAHRQAALAQRRFNDVRKLAHAVVFDYHDLVAPLRGATPVRERLVRDAIEYLDALSREAGQDRVLLREMATAYDKVGRVQGNAYFPNLGDTEGALRSYRRSLELREQLLGRDPHNPELQDEVAKSYAGIGDVLYSKDDLRGALVAYEKGIEVRAAAVRAAPDNLLYQLELVVLFSRVGDLKGMEQYSNLGDTAGALASLRRGLDILESLYRTHPDDEDVVDQFANALTHAGMLACTAGDATSGLAMQRRAVELSEKLAAANPNSQAYEMSLLAAKHWLRFALEDNARTDEAIAISREVVTDLQKMLQSDPKNSQVRRNLGVALDMLGKNLLLAGDVAGALQNSREAVAVLEQVVSEAGSDENRANLAVARWRLGRAMAANSDHAGAIEHYREALVLREPAIATNAANSRARDDVASIHVDLAKASAAINDIEAAEQSFRRALLLAEEISAAAPSSARLRCHLALAHAEAGRLYAALNDRGPAQEHWAKSHAIWSELRESGRLVPAEAPRADEVARELTAL